jgi:hypothetical protein
MALSYCRSIGHHSQGGVCHYLSRPFYYMSIAAPEDDSIVPSFIEAIGDQVYVCFHGKNRWNWFKRNITAAERFNNFCSEWELHVASQRVGNLEQEGVMRAYTIFNNCS